MRTAREIQLMQCGMRPTSQKVLWRSANSFPRSPTTKRSRCWVFMYSSIPTRGRHTRKSENFKIVRIQKTGENERRLFLFWSGCRDSPATLGVAVVTPRSGHRLAKFSAPAFDSRTQVKQFTYSSLFTQKPTLGCGEIDPYRVSTPLQFIRSEAPHK